MGSYRMIETLLMDHKECESKNPYSLLYIPLNGLVSPYQNAERRLEVCMWCHQDVGYVDAVPITNEEFFGSLAKKLMINILGEERIQRNNELRSRMLKDDLPEKNGFRKLIRKYILRK